MENLNRFIEAQANTFETALAEIKSGRKRSHWMWFIFPQLKGLGFSDTAQYYGIQNGTEAEAFLNHPLLGKRLIEITAALLELQNDNATEIFGSPDNLKLKSSMTLFASLNPTSPVFHNVLEKFFDGQLDKRTLELLATK
jgi:uncharacterized protein (DUF1810 family)